MARRRAYRAISRVDPKALAEFQAGIRKRYSDAEILGQLKSCAARLGRSPTMREFADDSETTIHPQTVIERFGSWNRAKRAAGLVPRRFATKEELLRCLRELGEKLDRTPTAKDVDANGQMAPILEHLNPIFHTSGVDAKVDGVIQSDFKLAWAGVIDPDEKDWVAAASKS